MWVRCTYLSIAYLLLLTPPLMSSLHVYMQAMVRWPALSAPGLTRQIKLMLKPVHQIRLMKSHTCRHVILTLACAKPSLIGSRHDKPVCITSYARINEQHLLTAPDHQDSSVQTANVGFGLETWQCNLHDCLYITSVNAPERCAKTRVCPHVLDS